MNISFIAQNKEATDVMDYGFDFTAWLAGDTISSSTWVVPTGIIQDSESETTLITTIWLSGGTAGSNYIITNTIITVAGRTKEISFLIYVI